MFNKGLVRQLFSHMDLLLPCMIGMTCCQCLQRQAMQDMRLTCSVMAKVINQPTIMNIHSTRSSITILHGSNSLEIAEPMTLAGHSLGGALSLIYALRYPERVRALVLVNPFYNIHQLPLILRIAYRRKLINTMLMDRTPYRLFSLNGGCNKLELFLWRTQDTYAA